MSDLGAALSRKSARKPRAAGGLPVARLAAAGIALLVGGAVLRVALVDDPLGGRPSAEAEIGRAVNSVAEGISAANPATISVGPEIPLTEINSPSIITLDGGPGLAAASVAPEGDVGPLPELVETSEFGPLPRIAADGETPFEAYRRPAVSVSGSGGKPLIAVVVTGLGLNVGGTLDAVAALPDTVTLAFAPYGRGLEETVEAARAEGHEILLEVPLEPFDYPDNDPGPETLLTGQSPRDNMAKLYTVMGRLGGYVGLINNMGARFTASGADFGPVMEELGARGLGYLDDGSSNRSLAPQLAKANAVPFGRADLTLDTDPERAAILAQLEALEKTARSKGSAVAVVSALPISISTVSEWAAGLEERGIMLVPASALMTK